MDVATSLDMSSERSGNRVSLASLVCEANVFCLSTASISGSVLVSIVASLPWRVMRSLPMGSEVAGTPIVVCLICVIASKPSSFAFIPFATRLIHLPRPSTLTGSAYQMCVKIHSL